MKTIRILLVEDDADDVELLQEAIRDNNVNCTLDVVMEGDKVIPYLEKSKSLPEIIVMDFNLPKLHGKEILSIIRSSKAFAHIPIIVLTTSASPQDMKFALENGANKFITKPNTIKGFNLTVETIVSLVILN